MLVGILALQGNFNKHANILNLLEIENIYVNSKDDLFRCDALIMPGGESTTISKLIYRYSLESALRDFSVKNNIFGTCAGAIIMSKNSNDSRVFNLGCMNVDVERNAWGTQINSFIDNIYFLPIDSNIPGVFIRAPKITSYDDSECIGTYKQEPVIIRNAKHLISTCHPELTDNLAVHKYFINMINE